MKFLSKFLMVAFVSVATINIGYGALSEKELGPVGPYNQMVSFEEDSILARRGGGGFRGGSSKSFSSKSSSKSSWSSSSSKRPSTTKPVKTETPKSIADRKAYEKAKSNGKAFSTKSEAIKDFKGKAKTDPAVKKQLEKDYPTKYDKEPAQRPAHIPEKHNGQTVIYQNGGYGYQGPDGFTMLTTFMLMDTMSDAMLLSSMQQQGYHIGAAPVAQYTASGSNIIVNIILIVICVVGFTIFVFWICS